MQAWQPVAKLCCVAAKVSLLQERLLTNYDITCSILLDESVMKGPTVFATGTHTGDIIVWNVQKTDVETM